MNRIAKRTFCALFLALVLVLGLVFFLVEYALDAKQWVVFPGSPHVYRGANLDCGIITDRSGLTLLDSTDGRVYHDDATVRKATLHLLGDRYGYISASALAGFSDKIVGFDYLNGLYTTSGTGGTATLTISAAAQTAALEALGGKKGTVAVYNYKTGEILCAVTSPTYDPDNEPDIAGDTTGAYDGVYVNRFLQATYTPGSIFKVATSAAALSEIPGIEERTFTCEGSYSVSGTSVTCPRSHGQQTLRQALAVSCNCVFAQISLELGKDTLSAYVQRFCLTEPCALDGTTTAGGTFDLSDADDAGIAWSGIGQYTDLVGPCRFLQFMGQIAGGGTAAEPYLVRSVSSGPLSGYHAKTTMTDRILSTSTATKLQSLMRHCVINTYGDSNFPDIQVCGKSGTAQVGDHQQPNATFAGFSMDEDYPLAFVVFVEDAGSGSGICVPILSRVLPVCMEALDAE